jgi:ParB family chromosome partitioning protein
LPLCREQLCKPARTIVEIETDKILASFVTDRFEDSSQPPAELIEQIKDRGQLVPILVRPHPERKGIIRLPTAIEELRPLAN